MRRIAALLSLAATLVSCQSAPRTDSTDGTAASKKVVIGLSLDTVREERWQRDRDEFVRHAESLGAEVRVQVANNDHTRQVAQCECAGERSWSDDSWASTIRLPDSRPMSWTECSPSNQATAAVASNPAGVLAHR